MKVCASNGVLYRNLCELKRDNCIRGENFQPVDHSYCNWEVFLFIDWIELCLNSGCEIMDCPSGQCKQQSNGKIRCECQQCSTQFSNQELICGDNGITYP